MSDKNNSDHQALDDNRIIEQSSVTDHSQKELIAAETKICGDSCQNDGQQSSQATSVIQRSESVIKSPSSSKSAPTPVIQVVVDTASGHSQANNEQSGGDHQQIKKSSPSICSPSNGANLLMNSNISLNNPFLRASSFHTNSSSSSTALNAACNDDASDSSSNESQIIFAPPKLIPTPLSPPNTTSSFLKPSILKLSSSFSSEIEKPSETISASKTFISLNKEDIGKIKTPAFIKLTSASPLIGTSNGGNTNNSVASSSSDDKTKESKSSQTFLFGQKVEDRVVIDQSDSASNNHSASSCILSAASGISATVSSSTICSSSDRPHLISFSDVSNGGESAIQSLTKSVNADKNSADSSISFASSSNSSRNGENNADSIFKRKYEVITGEEDEHNVLSIYGRLYAWDTEKASWVEKGRGSLHLNDVMKDDKLCSRLVMRTAGAYRLILNALIVAGMTFELANENCLRFTYIDGIYMIKGQPKEIDQLHSAIEHRLRDISKRSRSNE